MTNTLDNRALSSIGAGSPNEGQYKAAFDNLKSSIDNLQKPLADMADGINTINKNLSNTSKSGDDFMKTVEGITSSFESWSKVIKIINEVGEAFGATEAIFTDGLSEIIPLLLAIGPDLIDWAKELINGKEALDKTKLSLDVLKQALQNTQFSGAVKQVDEFTINIALAKQGLLDKKEVLAQYNETLGKSMGQVSDLGVAEDKIVKKGPAYIKMMLLKAKAQAAIEEAAKKQIAAEQDKLKSDDDSLTKMDKVVGFLKGLASFGLEDPEDVASAKAEAAAERHKKAMQRRAEMAKDDLKEAAQYQEVAKQAQTKMAKAAKENQLDPLENQQKPDNSGSERQKARMKAALNEAEQMKKDSLARQLQITMQSYGDELAQENAHYAKQIEALQGMLSKKVISQEKFKEISEQLQSEYHTAVGALIDKFNTEDADKAQQAMNDLVGLQIKGMEDGSAKQIAELNQQQQERNQQYEKIEADDKKHLAEIQAEIDKAKKTNPNADVTGLQNVLDKQMQIIALHNIKRVTDEEQTEAAIKKIKAKEVDDDAKKANDKLLQTDQKAIDDAKPDDKQNAERQLVLDKYAFEIEQAKKAGKDITDLVDARDEAIAAIEKKYDDQDTANKKKKAQDIKNFEVQTAQQVSNAAFSIVKNSISSQADAKIKQLEADKNSELSNTSLTAAQKQAIQQDYQKKEAAIKIKAFKDEQLASIGQALINGALAVTKATAQTGVLSAFAIPAIIAETAIQVATITAQKPPAYARGGVHYHSDGRGGVLSGYSRTDNTNAYLRSGEGIIVSEAMRVPWARNLVSAINVGFGGRDFSMPAPTKGFAVGGIFTDGGDANRYYNQPVHDQKNLANTIAYQMINNFPPVYVDVKDINNQQNILAQTINRVNL